MWLKLNDTTDNGAFLQNVNSGNIWTFEGPAIENNLCADMPKWIIMVDHCFMWWHSKQSHIV